MDLGSIKALPVSSLAAENCVLFLWVTFPMPKEALSVLDAWGFVYKTVAFTWVKENRKSPGLFWGLGYWTRANAEVCLLVTRGSPKRQSASVHQVIAFPVERHSKKPDAVRAPILLPNFSVHNLRHTFCTRFCENETNLKIIQEIIGHVNISTTMDIYHEATIEKKKAALKTWRKRSKSAESYTKIYTTSCSLSKKLLEIT